MSAVPEKKPRAVKRTARSGSQKRTAVRIPDDASSQSVARSLARRARARRAEPVEIDQSALQLLVGYNCRRAYLAILERSIQPMADLGLRRTWFSVLVLLHHNPGVSSRRLCEVLGVQPPNLVGLVASFEERGVIERRTDPDDARAIGLYLTPAGRKLMSRIEREVRRAEIEATSMLTDKERETLNRLLVRIYTTPQA